MGKSSFAMKNELLFEEAFAYAQKVLKDGNTLGRKLLAEVDFTRGTFYALVGDRADLDALYKFTSGGILPQNTLEEKVVLGNVYMARKRSDSIQFLVSYLQDYVRGKKGITSVFEEMDFQVRDMEILPSYSCTMGEEIYYVLDSNECMSELLVEMIGRADASWYYLNVLTRAKVPTNLLLSHLSEIAKAVEVIVIGAYDNEGYVVWEPHTAGG